MTIKERESLKVLLEEASLDRNGYRPSLLQPFYEAD